MLRERKIDKVYTYLKNLDGGGKGQVNIQNSQGSYYKTQLEKDRKKGQILRITGKKNKL